MEQPARLYTRHASTSSSQYLVRPKSAQLIRQVSVAGTGEGVSRVATDMLDYNFVISGRSCGAGLC